MLGKTYTPTPNGVAHRAIEALKLSGKKELSSVELARTLGVGPSLSPILKRAVENGLLVCQKRSRFNFYSLPNSQTPALLGNQTTRTSSGYYPHEGSVSFKVIEILKTGNKKEISATELSRMLRIKSRNLSSLLQHVVEAGGLIRSRIGRVNFYSMPLNNRIQCEQAKEPAKTDATEKVVVSLQNDGGMFIKAPNHSTGMFLTREETSEVYQFFLHVGGWLERLEQHRNEVPA